jgi:hypothetical protein
MLKNSFKISKLTNGLRIASQQVPGHFVSAGVFVGE